MKINASPESWLESQSYELDFWKNKWPYRNLPLPELQILRHRDAIWILNNLEINVSASCEYTFDNFSGNVLEVGCGPIGFFELTKNVNSNSHFKKLPTF